MGISTVVIPVLVATIACFPTLVNSQRQRGSKTGGGMTDGPVKRDLTIFKRPPWNYNPDSPGTGCVDPNTFFDTNVAVNFQGDPTANLDMRTLMDLEDAFQQSYNKLRTNFCDDKSRKVTAVEIDKDSFNVKTLDEFSLRFLLKVGCDRCSVETNLFEPEPDNNRRELEVFRRPPINTIRGSSSPRSPPNPVNPPPSATTTDIPPDMISRVNEDCCPPNGERRGPFASEFTAIFDSTYKALGTSGRALQADPIQQILDTTELVSIICEEPLEEFEADVLVVLGGNPEDVTESEIFALESSFQASYNGFSDTLCDPFFRGVTEVSAELEDSDVRYLNDHDKGGRTLQRRRARYKYRVKGRCRGCRRNRRLFAQGSSGRRLEMQYDRRLQFVFDENSCYCAVGAAERGVYEEEFAETYDLNIQELNTEGILTNIASVEGVEEDIIFTWSPTMSPTNYPTGPTDSPVPSPSPSEVPTTP